MRVSNHAAWLAAICLCAFSAPGPAENLSLDDLFGDQGAADVAVSPSGRYLAAVVRGKGADLVAVHDLTTGDTRALTKVGLHDVGELIDSTISSVIWKGDDRLLFRVSIYPAQGVSLSRFMSLNKMGERLFSIERTGKNAVRLLAQNRNSELDMAFDLGDIRSLLPHDPNNILMVVDGLDGRSLFKVNVITGKGEVVQRAKESVWDWWLDLDGNPVVQVEVSRGQLRFYRREKDSWKKFYSVRLRELKEQNEYEPLGPSDQPGKFYVLARPEGAQRRGVYLYDLFNESFGPPVAEHPQYDIFDASIARDGKRVQRFCYIAHVRICESSDAANNAHIAAVRRYFKDSANVYVSGASENGETLLLFVEGPSDLPAYYQYQAETRNIVMVGLVNEASSKKQLPSASIVEYAARDGLKINGYLTRPPGAVTATNLPLVVMPHGGPEARDHLAFDVYVQYLAARGYAVFQPNFRGSEGFGRAFIDKGYGEWGRKMQDDINDGVKSLVDQKIVDPQRICIVGASYGGYAALAGATFTPDLYRCAVSISGVADLREYLKSRRKRFGTDSELYSYWKKQIGDPDSDAARIDSVSPALHVQQIRVPILLVHGDADEIVPYEQSQKFKKILDKAGRKTELITLEDEGHSGWTEDDERTALTAIGNFLNTHLGAGFVTP